MTATADAAVDHTVRAATLARARDYYDLHANEDYDYSDLDIEPGADVERYLAVKQDETYSKAHLWATLDEAHKDLADSVGDEYGTEPVGVLDLDTGLMAPVAVEVIVTADENQSPFEFDKS